MAAIIIQRFLRVQRTRFIDDDDGDGDDDEKEG